MGKCYTLFSRLSYPRSEKNKKSFWNRFEVFFKKNLNNRIIGDLKDLNLQTLIHDPNQLPSFTLTDNVMFDISLIKSDFVKLFFVVRVHNEWLLFFTCFND